MDDDAEAEPGADVAIVIVRRRGEGRRTMTMMDVFCQRWVHVDKSCKYVLYFSMVGM